MKIVFLGTGTSQGIPVIGSTHPVCLSKNPKDKRLRVSLWITWDDYSFVIDCGPDFRLQMLRSGCSKLDALFFTHEHADHTAGLDDIRPFYFKQGDISLYAHKRVLQNLEKRFDYIFANENKYPGAPSVKPFEVLSNHSISFSDKQIVPINAMHGNLQVFGYRFGTFAYLTDIKTISDEELLKLQNLDVLVINALREEVHPTHLNLEEALDIICKINPKKTYLTHISHLFGFHTDIEKRLPNNVFVAFDNLEIFI